MKIQTLWIVTRPMPDATILDICFSADANRLQLQFLGGLKGDEIVGMFTDEYEALRVANELLEEYYNGVTA